MAPRRAPCVLPGAIRPHGRAAPRIQPHGSYTLGPALEEDEVSLRARRQPARDTTEDSR